MEGVGSAAESRDQFLELLVTQLQNQDPLAPTKQEDFLAQLAQFSTVEGIENLNHNFEQFFEAQETQATELQRIQVMSNASSLMGKEISFTTDGEVSSGVVEAVVIDGDTVSLRVDEQLIGLDRVQEIQEEPSFVSRFV